jgi:hypothetical protein
VHHVGHLPRISVIYNLFRAKLLNDVKNTNIHKFNLYRLEFRIQLKLYFNGISGNYTVQEKLQKNAHLSSPCLISLSAVIRAPKLIFTKTGIEGF